MTEGIETSGVMTRSERGSDREADWTSYSDARLQLSLQHPSDWTAQRGSSGLLVTVVGPQSAAGFAPNLNVVRRANDVRLALDDLAEAAIREVRRVLTDFMIIDLDPAIVVETPARRVLFAYRQGIYGLTGEQWMWLTRDHIWTVTAGAATEDYHEVADVFDRMLRSLRMGES